MSNWARQVAGQWKRYSIRQFRKDTGVSVRDNPPPERMAEHGVYPYTVIDATHDPDTQVLEPWEFQGDSASLVYTRPVRAMTAQELANKARREDESQVERGVILIGTLMVELVDGLLANGTITPATFDQATINQYQTLKQAIDRLKQ